MVRTRYNGRTRVWEKLGKQFSGRHKFDFGPRAVLRGFHARKIFLGKSLSKVADSFEPYPTNIPSYEVPVAPVPRLDGKIV